MGYFKAGGPLSADAPSYIERPADRELFKTLAEGELCLVLGPRQMGKTSLMVRAISYLAAKGINAGICDLQHLGSQRDPDSWFSDVVFQINRSLALRTDSVKWWRDNRGLGPTQRFRVFLEDVVLGQLPGDVVIFIDEIDSVLPLPFSDDFFTTVRSFYVGRALSPVLTRLNFVLSGVANPSSFIRDRSRTPFNVGKIIVLEDFDRESTSQFQKVLGQGSEQVIDRIFYWTDGQPFLVQQMAAAVFSWPMEKRRVEQVDDEVRRSYLERKIEFDTHLKFIQDYLLADADNLKKVLSVYQRVLTGREIAEDERSPVQSCLKLAGVVKVEGKKLVIRNRIYEIIFDLQWVGEHLEVFFQVGGTLSVDLPSYIERPADRELLRTLETRELCLVLGPPQMGKSSLIVHTIPTLRERGQSVGVVDLTAIGHISDPELWFLGLAERVQRSLLLEGDMIEWWRNHEGLSPARRFKVFLEDVVLTDVAGDVVIIIDEVDFVLDLPFVDDFFATILDLYKARAASVSLRRLNFVLSGVLDPPSIRNYLRILSNTIKAISIGDFDRPSMVQFEQVLGLNGKRLVDRIFHWTNGQPFLTHKLTAAAFSWPADARNVERVDDEIRTSYLERKIESDSHLESIQHLLLADSQLRNRVLNTYRRGLEGREIAEDEHSRAQSLLKLSGLIKVTNKQLAVRNRIYESVFGLQWIGEHSSTEVWRYLVDLASRFSTLLILMFVQLPLVAGTWLWVKDKIHIRPVYAVLVALFSSVLC
jgi:energy-coupling factor transporter ATP-binding protein EcfA2